MHQFFKRYSVVFMLLAVVGVGLYFVLPEKKDVPVSVVRAHHQSIFFKHASFIEHSLREVDGDTKVGLDQVLGGVVSHHIPVAIPMLADFYTRLKNTRDVKTFIVLAPDHVDAGRGNINVSKEDFVMPFGTLKPNLSMIEKLEASGFVVQDETPFEHEHSIDSQLLLISRLFPDAQIVPLVFRSSATNKEAREFGKILSGIADEGTFIVCSVDFSHYLSEKQARPIDILSAKVLRAVDSRSTELIDADSEQALVALMSFLEIKNADRSAGLEVFNTKDFSENDDYTTGYVSGFWGI